MDRLTRLSRETQAVLAASVLYLIFSFLDWQQVSGQIFNAHVTAGLSEWHGVGVIAGLLVIALLLWEAVRLLEVKIELGSVTPGLISVALALLLLLFTIITFLSHSTARHWPAWLGLLLSIVIAACAVVRARAEGVQMPTMPASIGGGASAASAEPASEPAPPAAPAVAETPPDSPGGTEPV